MQYVSTWTLIASLTSLAWLHVASSKGSRRFVLDTLGDIGNIQHISCKVCYDCLCKGDWEECLDKFLSHDKIRHLCPVFAPDLNLNCTAPYAQGGDWSHWSSWGACQGPCDDGARTRTRSCSNPSPYNCGDECEGDEYQEHPCTPQKCNPTPQTTTMVATTTKATTTTTTTTTASPSTAAKTVPTTTAVAAKVQSCSKFCTVATVAQNDSAEQTEARTCPDGIHDNSDALLIKCCNMHTTPTWTRGTNVVLGCASIPRYTPIGRFDSQTYTTGTAGVFVECLPAAEHGFKFIHQTCEKTPEIIHVSTTNTTFDAIKYYTILQ